jgi:cytochrome c556
MKSVSLAALSVLVLAGGALADPVADRRALMKNFGGIGRELFQYAEGVKAYDAAAILAALQALGAETAKFDVAALFPDGSDMGDTKASPKIWQDRAAFQAEVDKFIGDAAKAAEAAPPDLAAFMPVLDTVANDCRSCHAAWRN